VELTPLIDVVFLLLIFFMVSTGFIEDQALNVDLPDAQGLSPAHQNKVINIVIRKNGAYEVDGTVLVNASLQGITNKLEEIVSARSNQPSQLPVVISADENATHQSVVRVMDACAQLGLIRISLATKPITTDPGD
jgi:biopolymer transport protein ExbD